MGKTVHRDLVVTGASGDADELAARLDERLERARVERLAADDALKLASAGRVGVVVACPADADELAGVLPALREADPTLPVVVAGGALDAATVRRAFRAGAVDCLPTADPDLVGEVVAPLVARRAPIAEGRLLPERSGMPALLGRSKPMREVVRLVEKVAPSDTTVLILGESGTGKELIARALHVLSPRARGPFVAINCAAIPETLLENELFGHEKGAYTGANAKAIGKVEAADKGTLFLDEIGEMPLPLQAKILRLLQDKTYDRIGGTKTRRADIRIIAATNRDLKEQVAARRFREDLYYRLSVVPITLPALRERPEDIPLLAQVVLERQAEALGRPGLRFSPEALERIVAYRWPGNVRELENEIERAAVLAHGDVIEAGDLELSARVADPDLAALARLVPLEGSLEDVLARLSSRAARILAAAAVDTAGGDRARAAENLGISVERLESLLASV
ncbi:MAG: sigma 54-interacting transcriptional regulator [Acidobacteriota bacterium]